MAREFLDFSQRWTLVLLCAYGFSKEIRPSEPYLTQYLTGYKGLDEDDVYQKIYPVWPYSYFALLVPVFLLTDLLRYKPVINLEGAAYVGTWCLLLWADGVGAMQGMQFLYGVATSTEVAYYTYIYAKVPKDDYKMASSLTRGAILTGKFVSGLLGQVLDSTQALSYRDLNYVSLTSVSVAMVFSFFLPRVRTSIYFHKNADYGSTGERRSIDEESDKDSDKDSGDSSSSTKEGISAEQLKRPSTAKVFRTIIMEAKTIYSDSYVVKWSIWVAASTCLNFQVGNYIQGLWEEIQSFEDGDIYNGAVEAATTLTGAVVVLAVGFVRLDWSRLGDYAILVASLLGGSVLAAMGRTDQIWFAYAGYLFFRMSYQLLMTVASFEIAKRIERDAFGLVFGINTWVGLGLQTILTLSVADAAGLALPVQDQFLVYGGLYLLTGAVFSGYFIFRRMCGREE